MSTQRKDTGQRSDLQYNKESELIHTALNLHLNVFNKRGTKASLSHVSVWYKLTCSQLDSWPG